MSRILNTINKGQGTKIEIVTESTGEYYNTVVAEIIWDGSKSNRRVLYKERIETTNLNIALKKHNEVVSNYLKMT